MRLSSIKIQVQRSREIFIERSRKEREGERALRRAAEGKKRSAAARRSKKKSKRALGKKAPAHAEGEGREGQARGGRREKGGKKGLGLPRRDVRRGEGGIYHAHRGGKGADQRENAQDGKKKAANSPKRGGGEKKPPPERDHACGKKEMGEKRGTFRNFFVSEKEGKNHERGISFGWRSRAGRPASSAAVEEKEKR